MRCFRAIIVMFLLCCLSACNLGVAWLPDSSGFVFTTSAGHLVHYDAASKKQRVLVTDKAAAVTCWPAVSPDGKKIAVAGLDGAKGEKAKLRVDLYDLEGKSTHRSPDLEWGEVKGKDTQFLTQLFWSPDGKKLLVHGMGTSDSASEGHVTGLYDLAGKKAVLWKNHVPAIFGATPIRPDGQGFLLSSVVDNETGAYFWVDWKGNKKDIKSRKERLEPEGPGLWPTLGNSRWNGPIARLTTPEGSYAIDTAKLEENQEKVKPADFKVKNEYIRMRAELAGGLELLALETDDGDMRGPAIRVVTRKPGKEAVTEIIPAWRDRLVLFCPSPDRKHLVVRVWYGLRGAKGDTIHVIGRDGKVADQIGVFERYISTK